MATDKNLDQWVKNLNVALERAVDIPVRELPSMSAFSDWRITYGVQTEDKHTSSPPTQTYFLSFYPAFCTKPKATFHYINVAELAFDVVAMKVLAEEVKISFSDVVAAICSHMRGKESIELFQEQKDLMVLGLKHYHLDNFYQDVIKAYANELYEKGTIKGVKVDLTIFKNLKKEG